MRLSDLGSFNPITIQCHDNPDADAMASGFALYCYFLSRNKEVRLVYSGVNRITKANLKLMIEKLGIPIQFLPPSGERMRGLLILVDCQYGTGNVTRFEADEVAVIDHHQVETQEVEYSFIRPNLGSCSTLVWNMLRQEHFPVNTDMNLGTALYYGLYMDTNQFAEIYNPLDLDMRETIAFKKQLITLFRNSNLSLKELEIAGIAMIRYSYDDEHRFAVIKAEPCDPNILGLISDLLIQVDEIDTCVVYNEAAEGFKLSVRSCIKEVKANELAAFLTEGNGSGGGHFDKAGGFISRTLYDKDYKGIHSEVYIKRKMKEYFESFRIIYAGELETDLSGMKFYRRRRTPMGYVKLAELMEPGSQITVRTQCGDLDMVVEENSYLMIDGNGEVRRNTGQAFERYFNITGRPFSAQGCGSIAEYVPTIKNWQDGTTLSVADYARLCVPNEQLCVYASLLETGIKVFTQKQEDIYMLGRPGDYFAVCQEDRHHIFTMEKKNFEQNFEEIKD